MPAPLPSLSRVRISHNIPYLSIRSAAGQPKINLRAANGLSSLFEHVTQNELAHLGFQNGPVRLQVRGGPVTISQSHSTKANRITTFLGKALARDRKFGYLRVPMDHYVLGCMQNLLGAFLIGYEDEFEEDPVTPAMQVMILHKDMIRDLAHRFGNDEQIDHKQLAEKLFQAVFRVPSTELIRKKIESPDNAVNAVYHDKGLLYGALTLSPHMTTDKDSPLYDYGVLGILNFTHFDPEKHLRVFMQKSETLPDGLMKKLLEPHKKLTAQQVLDLQKMATKFLAQNLVAPFIFRRGDNPYLVPSANNHLMEALYATIAPSTN